MSELIGILGLLGFIGGFITVVALWTQRESDRAKEKDSTATKANEGNVHDTHTK